MGAFFENSSRTRSLILLGLLFIWFNLMLSQFLSKEHALDLQFAYGVETAYLSLGNLSLEQRELYRFGLWALDMPYMIVYTLLLIGVLTKLWADPRLRLLPVLIFAADLFENLMILRLLKLYPQQHDLLVYFASFFSTSKWIAVISTFTCLLFGIGRLVFQKKPISVSARAAKI